MSIDFISIHVHEVKIYLVLIFIVDLTFSVTWLAFIKTEIITACSAWKLCVLFFLPLWRGTENKAKNTVISHLNQHLYISFIWLRHKYWVMQLIFAVFLFLRMIWNKRFLLFGGEFGSVFSPEHNNRTFFFSFSWPLWGLILYHKFLEHFFFTSLPKTIGLLQ